MPNNEIRFIDELNYLRNQAKFSIDEIIPVLEEKISTMKNEEYMIDFFITGNSEKGLLDVRYLAFPKQESYVKALFAHKGNVYKYKIQDKKHASLKSIDATKLDYEHLCFNNLLEIKESENVFLIGHEYISVQELFAYLLMPHKEDYHLRNDFFCYDEQLDMLDETITEFVKKKASK